MKFQGRKNKLSEILQTDELGLSPLRLVLGFFRVGSSLEPEPVVGVFISSLTFVTQPIANAQLHRASFSISFRIEKVASEASGESKSN